MEKYLKKLIRLIIGLFIYARDAARQTPVPLQNKLSLRDSFFVQEYNLFLEKWLIF
jgi:hypothetical protein